MIEAYLGAWVLDPAASDYGDAEPPARAVHCLMPTADGVWLHLDWTEADGERRAISLTTSLDRQRHRQPTGIELIGWVDADGLHIEAHQAEALVMRSTRRVVGDVLTVVEQTGGGQTVSTYQRTRVKQVMAYRRDLKMRKGKIAAQCAHASLCVFTRADRGAVDSMVVPLDGATAVWLRRGSAKVVLSVESEADLLTVHQAALERGLPTALITDSGRTEFGGVPTRTAVSVGPAVVGEIDMITGRDGIVPTKLA